MLIGHLVDDTICFKYRRKLEMFYSSDIKCADVAERLRLTETIKVYVEKLPDECYKFEFHLAEKCHPAENCNITSESYNESCPKSWETFLDISFPPHWTKSVKIQLKLDTIFHIIYYVTYNGKKHNPFHVGLPKLFLNHSRAKLVTQLLNKVSFCISYDELERINLVLWNK